MARDTHNDAITKLRLQDAYITEERAGPEFGETARANLREKVRASTITIRAIQILRLRFSWKSSRYATIQRGIGEDFALGPRDGGGVVPFRNDAIPLREFREHSVV